MSLPKSILLKSEQGHVEILELLSKSDSIDNFKKDGKSLLHLSIEKGIGRYAKTPCLSDIKYSSLFQEATWKLSSGCSAKVPV